MAHNLFLGMYTFNIKKSRTSNENLISNNDFLSNSYPDIEGSKFGEGFVKDVVSFIDSKTFKNSRNTHGGVLEEKALNSMNRTLDIMIDGGITGLKQFLIEEDGEKSEISDKVTVGLKFFARIWLPGGSNTGYVFIQKYGSLSIKPLFDDLIAKVYRKHGYSVIGGKLSPSTTKARMKEFLKKSRLRDLVIVSQKNPNQTGAPNSTGATIRIRNVNIKKSTRRIDNEDINNVLKDHGFKIGKRSYLIKATYENKTEEYNEEKTVIIDGSEETINVIPSVLLPNDCINVDNHPVFDRMREFTDEERVQVMIEAKLN